MHHWKDHMKWGWWAWEIEETISVPRGKVELRCLLNSPGGISMSRNMCRWCLILVTQEWGWGAGEEGIKYRCVGSSALRNEGEKERAVRKRREEMGWVQRHDLMCFWADYPLLAFEVLIINPRIIHVPWFLNSALPWKQASTNVFL